MKALLPYKEIRKLLDESENPLFLYDDDPDGLCSYLLLRKYLGRGKGMVVKTAHFVNSSLIKVVRTYSPDKIFILDVAKVSQDFVDKINIPIIWIDHHDLIDLKGIKVK